MDKRVSDKPASKGKSEAGSSAPMRLRHIEVFNAIYLSGTISAAAQLLNVSQPSLSKTLQHAEDQLGFKLFRRVRGRLLPTEEAHIVYRETREVYERIEMLQQACRSLRAGDDGHLRVAVIHAAGLEVAPAAIASFRRRYPRVTFDVRSYHHEESLRALFDRTSELAIVWGAAVHPRVAAQKVGQGELVVVYPKGQLTDVGERVPIHALAGRDMIGIQTSGPVGDLLSAHLNKLSESLNEVVSAHTFFVAAALVREGVGLAIVDELTARAAADERIEYKPLDPPVKFDIYAAHLEDRPLSHLAQKFVAELARELERRQAG
jgi:DNA-binding transcriptional LysR family regulator